MTFGQSLNKLAPFVVGIAMMCYGALLLHHANTLIKKRMVDGQPLSCGVSENILLEQGVAIILILLSIFVLNNSLYAHFPSMYQKLTYLGDVHTKFGGHPFMKYLQMTIVLAFCIYFLVDIEKHKECVKEGGGVGGEKLLVASNISIIVLISLFLLYKGIQMTQRTNIQNSGGKMVSNNPVYTRRKNNFRR